MGLLQDHYEGAICVVTGATSGNGEALTHHLRKLGATVYGVGRNPEKLGNLNQHWNVNAVRADLSLPGDVDRLIAQLPDRIDFVFHMAGNAVLGEDRVDDLRQSDLLGPIQLLDGLLSKMSPGGVIAVNTSGAAALGYISRLGAYQKVKREMVQWWADNRERYADHDVHLMLVFMGFIYTGIWSRAKGGTGLSRVLAQFGPGPRWYTRGILRAAVRKLPVAYPGLRTGIARVNEQGGYDEKPLAKQVVTTVVDTWLRLVERV